MELIFKIGLTLFATVVWFLGVRWVWTHQLDLGATIIRFTEKAVAPPGWVATRDPAKLYQNGSVVGDVTGSVQQQDKQVIFAQLANTGALKLDQPFEYQRLRLRAKHIDTAIGMKVDMGKTLTGVYEGVICEVVE